MAEAFPYPLVTTQWLAGHLGEDHLKIVDASWRMPGNPPAATDFLERHLPGAVFFDLDAVSDKSTPLPHMLPPVPQFERAMGALGVKADDRVIVYDDAGLFSAARVWWTFRAMGHDKVSVLDGGLPKWRAEDRPVQSGALAVHAATYKAQGARPMPRPMVRTADALRDFLAGGGAVLDARPAARFTGEAEEPRAGLRSGHMPGALSLPHSLLLEPSGEMKSEEALTALFRERGIGLETEIIASCGSGVTAAIIALALERLGHRRHAVYDGSWAEWGDERNDPALFPVAKG